MDAIKLYSEWNAADDTKEFASIFEVPQSHGRLDIMNVTDTNFFGDFSDGKMTCEFRFTKNAALFNLTMSEVTHIYGEAIAGTDSLDISIENGEQKLAFLIFEKGNPNLVFSVIFENGTLERIFPEFEGCVKVL